MAYPADMAEGGFAAAAAAAGLYAPDEGTAAAVEFTGEGLVVLDIQGGTTWGLFWDIME